MFLRSIVIALTLPAAIACSSDSSSSSKSPQSKVDGGGGSVATNTSVADGGGTAKIGEPCPNGVSDCSKGLGCDGDDPARRPVLRHLCAAPGSPTAATRRSSLATWRGTATCVATRPRIVRALLRRATSASKTHRQAPIPASCSATCRTELHRGLQLAACTMIFRQWSSARNGGTIQRNHWTAIACSSAGTGHVACRKTESPGMRGALPLRRARSSTPLRMARTELHSGFATTRAGFSRKWTHAGIGSRGLPRRAARRRLLTLLCSSACTDETRCHRTIVKAAHRTSSFPTGAPRRGQRRSTTKTGMS